MEIKGERQTEGTTLPVLPVKDTVVFPNMVVPILIKTDKYLPLIQEVTGKDKRLFVISRLGNGREEASDAMPRVGTVCRITKVTKEKEGTVVVVQGLSRASMAEIVSKDPFSTARVDRIAPEEVKGPRVDALKSNLMKLFTELVEISPNLPDEIIRICRRLEDASALADMI